MPQNINTLEPCVDIPFGSTQVKYYTKISTKICSIANWHYTGLMRKKFSKKKLVNYRNIEKKFSKKRLSKSTQHVEKNKSINNEEKNIDVIIVISNLDIHN